MVCTIKGCCCFDGTLKTGSRASAWFTVATGLIDIIIDIWALVHLHSLEANLEPHEKWVFLPPGIVVFMYLELAASFGMIIIGLCLLVGVNRKLEGESMVKTWKIGVIVFRGYEVLLGIYILAWVGAYRVSDIVYIAPELIVVTFYWIIDTVILISAVICVSSYWQEQLDSTYGKKRRAKFFSMLSNIRSAARGGRSGAATPSAMHSYYASQQRLNMSHGSLAPPMSQSSGYAPPSHQGSVNLQPPPQRIYQPHGYAQAGPLPHKY